MPDTKKLNIGVIGVGYLGQYHAQKYAQLATANLVAVVDSDLTRANEIATLYGANAFLNYEDILDTVDAVSIVVPTPLHYDIARFFLKHGKHVLVEKPITTTLEQADELIRLADEYNVLLQVGHLERFNNAVKAVEPSLSKPLFIESVRLSPFKLRGSDVNVILDLMIHDIDIIQSIVKAPIKDIRANGAPVLSPFIDIANARIEFENGCVANVTASRVSLKTERRLRIFQHDSYIGMDLAQKRIAIHAKGKNEMFPGIPEIVSEEHTFDQGDALNEQITAFVDAIIHNKAPLVSGHDGRRALETAIRITQIVKQQNLQAELVKA